MLHTGPLSVRDHQVLIILIQNLIINTIFINTVVSQVLILYIGLSNTLDFVLTCTRRTKPFLSGTILTTFPISHMFLGMDESVNNTKSPTATLRFGWSHFCLFCRMGIYSRIHLSQNISTRYCTCLHRRLE